MPRQSLFSSLYFSNAGSTYLLSLESRKIHSAAAERTSVFKFFEYNFVILNIDFNRVGAAYIHFGAHFLRDNYAAKFVNVTYNTCRFQFSLTFLKTCLWVRENGWAFGVMRNATRLFVYAKYSFDIMILNFTIKCFKCQ